jgi:protein-disulfide isomerase
MNSEKRSKRQERRERMKRQERRNRLIIIGSIVAGVLLVVVAIALLNPGARGPIAEVVAIDPGTYPNANDNSMGDPNAPIVIEEFSDFQCPYCKDFHDRTEPLLRQYFIDTGQVRFVYRSMGNWVSRNIGGRTTESQDAGLAVYCAGDQDLFWEMHAHLFANVVGEDAGSFTDERLKEIAQVTGLDMEQFNSCYDSGKYEDRVQQDFADGQAAGVNGTPGFLITYTVNGEEKSRLIEGAQPINVFQQELDIILNEIGTQ